MAGWISQKCGIRGTLDRGFIFYFNFKITIVGTVRFGALSAVTGPDSFGLVVVFFDDVEILKLLYFLSHEERRV